MQIWVRFSTWDDQLVTRPRTQFMNAEVWANNILHDQTKLKVSSSQPETLRGSLKHWLPVLHSVYH